MRGWGALKAVGLGAVTAVLLTSCIKLDVDLEVQSDDTIDGTLTVGLSKQLLQFVPGGASNIGSLITGTAGGQPEIAGAQDVKVTPFEDDRFVGETVSFASLPLEEASSGLGGDSGGDLTITKEGDRYRLQGTLDLTSTDTGTGLAGDLPVPDVNQLFSQAEIRIRVTFPGTVVETNGSADGCSVTWKPTFGQEVDLDAVAKTGGGCGGGLQWWSWVLIGLGGAVLVGAIVAIVFSIRYERHRHRRVSPGAPAAAAGGAPSGGLPPPEAAAAVAAPAGEAPTVEAPTAEAPTAEAPTSEAPTAVAPTAAFPPPDRPAGMG